MNSRRLTIKIIFPRVLKSIRSQKKYLKKKNKNEQGTL
jgi:hypothetical protein